jgi:hypothetical protein
MARNTWLLRHRKSVVAGAAVVLGVFLPIPGYLAAALFWQGGIHDLDSTSKIVAFVVVLFGVSGFVWGLLANAVLPRKS